MGCGQSSVSTVLELENGNDSNTKDVSPSLPSSSNAIVSTTEDENIVSNDDILKEDDKTKVSRESTSQTKRSLTIQLGRDVALVNETHHHISSSPPADSSSIITSEAAGTSSSSTIPNDDKVQSKNNDWHGPFHCPDTPKGNALKCEIKDKRFFSNYNESYAEEAAAIEEHEKDLDFAALLLSDVVVDKLMDNLAEEQPSTSNLSPEQPVKAEEEETKQLSSVVKNKVRFNIPKEENKSPSPAPSSGCNAVSSSAPEHLDEATEEVADVGYQYIDDENDTALRFLMRVACSATGSSKLCNAAAKASAFYLHRTMQHTEKPVLASLVSTIKSLKKLDVSNNNAGPVAIRALLTALTKHDCVEVLDISDNMADSECAEHVGRLLASSTKLRQINLSGNPLGKESLSKSLSSSMQTNANLTHLDISGCGATNLHGLFEALRAVCAQKPSTLRFLDISSNHVNDGQQLGTDISLILESQNCQLNHLNVSNTCLNSYGWSAIVTSLKSNTKLCEFIAGGSANKLKDENTIAQIVFSSQVLRKVSLGGIKMEETPNPDDIAIDTINFASRIQLKQLDLSDCGLLDGFLVHLAKLVPGKLCLVETVNLSNNSDITEVGLNALKSLLTLNGKSSLQSLTLSSLSVDYLPNLLQESFSQLKCLNLRKSRIGSASLMLISKIPQILEELILDGIKMSGSGVLENLFSSSSHHCLTSIGLSGCALNDSDLGSLAAALGRLGPPLNKLVNLDLSVNRISSKFVVELANALLTTANHPLEVLDLSNNEIGDEGACKIAEFVMSAGCSSNVKRIAFSNNSLSVNGLQALIGALAPKSQARGLNSLDVSNQKNSLDEDETESVFEHLAISVGFDLETIKAGDKNQHPPQLSPKFNVNLIKLGGSSDQITRQLDSVAIKTDFSKVCNTSATLADYLLIGAGLQQDSSGNNETVCFTTEEWSSVVGSDAPSWLKVEAERQKGVYIDHLPGTTTLQRLEGMLEMEADCEVNDVLLVKDPILRKPTGSAWVQFCDEESVSKALRWYEDGEAQMYGTPFSICSIPVSTSDAGEGAEAAAKREKAAREKKRKQDDEEDRAMMDASQQLADERAAYREAHPAYQNGRIW